MGRGACRAPPSLVCPGLSVSSLACSLSPADGNPRKKFVLVCSTGGVGEFVDGSKGVYKEAFGEKITKDYESTPLKARDSAAPRRPYPLAPPRKRRMCSRSRRLTVCALGGGLASVLRPQITQSDLELTAVDFAVFGPSTPTLCVRVSACVSFAL